MIIPIDVEFADEYGLKEAVFVSYLSRINIGCVMDGRRWYRKSMGDLRRDLPFWSPNTIRTVIQNCELQGLIHKTKNNPEYGNSVCSYALAN